MPDPRHRPLAQWGDELRRNRRIRRRSRLAVTAAAGATALATAVLGTLLWPPQPVLIWNASLSSPLGLYRIFPGREPALGDMVAAWAPEAARQLAAERDYLPGNVPLLKQVAATGGDEVCAIGDVVLVDGVRVATRRSHDRSGRPLPSWAGCAELRAGELLLLTPGHPLAYDGRYFGITRPHEVIGRASLIWRG